MKPRIRKTNATVAGEMPEIEAPQPLTLPRFSSWKRCLIYPLCILFPGGAFTLGALYFRQPDKDVARFGKICLGLGLLGALARFWHSEEFHAMESSDALTQPFY